MYIEVKGMLDNGKKLVLKNIVEQAIYANFNQKERKHINTQHYIESMIDCVEDAIALMIDEIKYNLSQIEFDPNEDSPELRETDSWHQ